MLDKQAVKDRVIEAAFEVDDPESSEHGRRLHHCFMGSIGADWDEAAVLDLIDQAEDVDWESHFLWGPGLAVYANGKSYFFDTVKPS